MSPHETIDYHLDAIVDIVRRLEEENKRLKKKIYLLEQRNISLTVQLDDDRRGPL